jgi:hypothetical protein
MDFKKSIFTRRTLFGGGIFCLLLGLAATVHAADEAEPVEEEIPTLPELGLYYDLGEDGKVNLRIVDNRFQIYFLDGEDHVQPLAYQSARIRYEGFFKKDEEGVLTLGPGSAELGSILTHPRFFRPPIAWTVYITLLDPSDESRNKSLPRAVLRQ